MKGIHIDYEDIEEVVSDKDKHLVIKLKKNEKTLKLRKNLLKQSGDDTIDYN